MKKCIKCLAEVNDDSVFCPGCGAKQEETKKRSIGLFILSIVGVAFATFLVFAVLGFILDWVDGVVDLPSDIIIFVFCVAGSVICYIFGIKGIKDYRNSRE